MQDLFATILGVIGLLAISSVLLPVATRINFPFTVLLALIGAVLGAVVVAFGHTDIWLIGDFMRSVSSLEITSDAVFFLFLPTLVFEAALSINVRQLLDDIFPILLLAIVGLLISTSLIGGAMWWVSGVSFVACLLLGAIVSATDPVAVIALFKDMGAPHRLATLVEGESLFNDATAIVLFTILASMLVSGQDADFGAGALDFLRVFVGGVLVGYILAWLTCNLIGLMHDVPLVEVTLTVCLAYFSFIAAEHYLHVSGVMAVVTAGLVLGSYGRTRISPESWTHLQVIWEQLGFWANSLIFFLVGLLVPHLLFNVTGREFGWLCVLIVTAFGARAVILYGLLPLLGRFRLAEKVSTEFELVMLWGGLRGAVSLALALAVLEHPQLSEEIKSFVVVLVTGFVLFTLFVNAPTMGILMHLLGIDKLEPAELAIRNRVMASSLANIGDSVRGFAQRCDLDPTLVNDVLGYYEERAGAENSSIRDVGELTHEDWVKTGLVTLVHAERMTYLKQFTEHLLSGNVTRLLLLMCDHIYDGLKVEGAAGFERTVSDTLNFDWRFRTAMFLHRRCGFTGLLGDRLADRFEVLLSSQLVLRQMPVDHRDRIDVLLGKQAAEESLLFYARRLDETKKSLDAMRLQYPEYAKVLERRHLGRLAL